MTKNFKTVIAAVLAFCLAFSLVACSSGTTTPDATDAPEATADATAAPTAEPTATPEPTEAPTPTPTPTPVPSTPEPTAIPDGYPVPDIFSANFTADGMTDTSGNDYEIVKVGEPTTKYSEALGRYVMVCEGGVGGEEDASNFSVFGYDKYYDSMLTSFTWECYALCYEGYQQMYIMSNLHAGGMAIGIPWADTDGYDYPTAYQIVIRDGGDYVYPQYCEEAPENTWVHLVATWDGTTAKLYMNGELVDSMDIANFAWTAEPGAQYLAIGCDTSADQNGEYFWNGEIARCNIYSQCLTADQVVQLYATATENISTQIK